MMIEKPSSRFAAAPSAVRAREPLHVPEKYAPYDPLWKTTTVRFDPLPE
jgi:hypothetical protein